MEWYEAFVCVLKPKADCDYTKQMVQEFLSVLYLFAIVNYDLNWVDVFI